MTRAPKLNRERLRLLTGAASVVLGEGHPTTQALARAITTWDWQDISRARAQMRQLDTYLRVLLDDLARRAGSRAFSSATLDSLSVTLAPCAPPAEARPPEAGSARACLARLVPMTRAKM